MSFLLSYDSLTKRRKRIRGRKLMKRKEAKIIGKIAMENKLK